MIRKKKYILIYSDYLIHLKFFTRFKDSLKQLNYEMFFITNKLSLLPFSFQKGIKIKLIDRFHIKKDNDKVKNSVEIKSKILTNKEGNLLYNSIYGTVKDILKIYDIKQIFLFGDSGIPEITIKDLAKKYSIPILFFELANIPGKIFVDHKGVNARSSLLNNIDVLKKYESNSKEFERWKEKYLKFKENETVVPQGKLLKKINNIFLPLDSIGYSLLKVPFSKKEKYLHKIISKFNLTIPKLKYDFYDLEKKYLFYPMQVSTDSQVLINSSINNFQAIEIALKNANEKNIDLVVKPHPAEDLEKILLSLMKLKTKKSFYIVQNNTFELIKNAHSVITINSTVGLEAMILGKDVEFLGQTFFKLLNKEYLKSYIQSYLIDIDFFSSANIGLNLTKQVLSRIRYENT